MWPLLLLHLVGAFAVRNVANEHDGVCIGLEVFVIRYLIVEIQHDNTIRLLVACMTKTIQ